MNDASQKGILILSHQGFSFIEDLAEQVASKSLRVFILSSRPAAENQHRRQVIKNLSTWCHVIDHRLALSKVDVEDAINQLKNLGYEVLSAISVWDGYRKIMAEINQKLKAHDITPEVVGRINDKLSMRQVLVENGLTSAKSQVATPQSLEEALLRIEVPEQRVFVKPRRGLASFAAFELKKDLKWEDIEKLRQEVKNDSEYSAVFSEYPEFLLEDYIDGQELSFEMIAVNGRCYALGVHEKIEISEERRTTLENACISPPKGLTPAELQTGISYIKSVMRAVGATSGCYHIEAKRRKSGTWDIIEINPRVGGAYIKESVKALTGGTCLLSLWLDSLLGIGRSFALDEFYSVSKPRCTTFFRVFFGEGGKVVSDIRIADFSPKPANSRLTAKIGQTLKHSEREIFVGQFLWTLPGELDPQYLAGLVRRSQGVMEVVYAS